MEVPFSHSVPFFSQKTFVEHLLYGKCEMLRGDAIYWEMLKQTCKTIMKQNRDCWHQVSTRCNGHTATLLKSFTAQEGYHTHMHTCTHTHPHTHKTILYLNIKGWVGVFLRCDGKDILGKHSLRDKWESMECLED